MIINNELRLWEDRNLERLHIKGLGPKNREKLLKAHIQKAIDLLSFLPREYRDFSQVVPIPDAPLNEYVYIRGKILSKAVSRTANKQIPVFEILVDDGLGALRAVWFNQVYLEKAMEKGATISLFGKIRFDKLGRCMNAPKYDMTGMAVQQGVEPIYLQVGGLKSKQISGWVRECLLQMPELEPLPKAVIEKWHFPSRKQALLELHHPSDAGAVRRILAREALSLKRLVFEEFFEFQLRLQEVLRMAQQRNHPRFVLQVGWCSHFVNQLPFALTADQSRMMDHFFKELAAGKRLHALVQGDVGCGKTILGFFLAYLFFQGGFQSALLCPTTMLAQQHYENALKHLCPFGIKVALLSSAVKTRKAVREAVSDGSAHFVVGTHKVFQKDIAFKNLGLAMIDEQHRFGVEQRRAFLKKGETAHYVAFSATPIPRSLAMTLYGDFQVLQLKQKPQNRLPIQTILKKSENRHQIIAFAKQRIQNGESVFWVFPLIEGSEEEQERSAIQMHRYFQTEVFSERSVGLVHGRMEKDLVTSEMEKFKAGVLHILVATTVIEVGVDAPTASIMVIENANQFGLSQLHQLRGRVGRGDHQSFCFLVLQEGITRQALQRMKRIASSDDGFVIAECDLKERGAGQLLGKKQSGVPDFRFGDPWLDRDLMDLARNYAREVKKKSNS